MSEKLLSAGDVIRILDIPKHKLNYLFEQRKLRDEDFLHSGRQRVYRESDLEKIKKALFTIRAGR